jgi:hypothetical protein
MTAFADMEKPSPLFRVNRWNHEGKSGAQYWFICPGCREAHAIGDTWDFNGDFDRPTFNPSFLTWNDPNPQAREGSKFRTGWRCHSYIRDGQMQFLSDCTHALAGETVEIPPWDDDQIMGLD